MLHCLEEVFSFSHKRDQWYRLVFLFALLSVTYLVSGCRSTTSQELYENAKFGVRLEKPGNWRLSLNERSGSIVLEPESGNGLKDSARIEIYGYACVPTLSHNTNETLACFSHLSNQIERQKNGRNRYQECFSFVYEADKP